MAFSASMRALTPSIISWTSWFSDLPSLLLLEMSNTPSSVSVCSPWMPLICTWNLSAISLNFDFYLASLGSLMCTEALKAVPRLVGHEVM